MRMTLAASGPDRIPPRAPAGGLPPPPCTCCGRQPGTIRESPILAQRDLCPPCHRRALLALLQPRPAPPIVRTGQQCPHHPGPPVVLTSARQHPHLADLGFSADEVAAAGTLLRCAVAGCGWWAWEGLVLDTALLAPPHGR